MSKGGIINYTFRTGQATVGSLNNYGLVVDSTAGSARVCNFDNFNFDDFRASSF